MNAPKPPSYIQAKDFEARPSPASLPLWHVWSEGYAATGEHGTAYLVGTINAETFNEACRRLHEIKGGERMLGRFTPERQDGRPPMYWGCRLYDNEEDARRMFG